MAGEVNDYSEELEASFLAGSRPKRFQKNERVEELKDDSIPTVDLSKEAAAPVKELPIGNVEGASIPVVMPPQAQTPKTTAPLPPEVPQAAAPTQTKEAAVQETLFSSSVTTPYQLGQALIEKYGSEWLEWEPETLWQEIRSDWSTSITRINMDKIGALKVLHVSDAFWRHWETFEKVVLAFNNLIPLFDRVQDVSMGQITHAMNQAGEIRKEEFHPEVRLYIAARAHEQGFIWLPSPLDVAQEELDGVLPPEVLPLKKEIRDRWDAFQGTNLTNVELPEDVYGVHLAKLAAINLYLEKAGAPEENEAE